MTTTTTQTSPLNAVLISVPQAAPNPQLDERLWRAWIDKNEKLDSMRFLRRVKITAILAALIGLVALAQKFAG